MKTKTNPHSDNLNAKYSIRIPAKMVEAMEALWGAQAPWMVRQLIASRLEGFDKSDPEKSRLMDAYEPIRSANVNLKGCHACLGRLVDFFEPLPKERVGIFQRELSSWFKRLDQRLLEIARLLELQLPRSRRGRPTQIAPAQSVRDISPMETAGFGKVLSGSRG